MFEAFDWTQILLAVVNYFIIPVAVVFVIAALTGARRALFAYAENKLDYNINDDLEWKLDGIISDAVKYVEQVALSSLKKKRTALSSEEKFVTARNWVLAEMDRREIPVRSAAWIEAKIEAEVFGLPVKDKDPAIAGFTNGEATK